MIKRSMRPGPLAIGPRPPAFIVPQCREIICKWVFDVERWQSVGVFGDLSVV